jgi:hypothetical protein
LDGCGDLLFHGIGCSCPSRIGIPTKLEVQIHVE